MAYIRNSWNYVDVRYKLQTSLFASSRINIPLRQKFLYLEWKIENWHHLRFWIFSLASRRTGYFVKGCREIGEKGSAVTTKQRKSTNERKRKKTYYPETYNLGIVRSPRAPVTPKRGNYFKKRKTAQKSFHSPPLIAILQNWNWYL